MNRHDTEIHLLLVACRWDHGTLGRLLGVSRASVYRYLQAPDALPRPIQASVRAHVMLSKKALAKQVAAARRVA